MSAWENLRAAEEKLKGMEAVQSDLEALYNSMERLNSPSINLCASGIRKTNIDGTLETLIRSAKDQIKIYTRMAQDEREKEHAAERRDYERSQ
jgi:protein tyrosine phosphatase (PTP) superfamily phosphohydrolase (DUF442 family)